MNKSTGAFVFFIVAVLLIVSYYLFPAFGGFVNVNAALLTFLGVLIAIFSLWYVLPREKNAPGNKVENEIDISETPKNSEKSPERSIERSHMARKSEIYARKTQIVKFNTYCIGVGRSGIQFLDAMKAVDIETGVNQIYPLVIPGSKFDYDLVDDLEIRKDHVFRLWSLDTIGYTGVGRDQHLAQQIVIKEGRRILTRIKGDIGIIERKAPVYAIILVGSLAGGTGGGVIPVLAKMIKNNFPDRLLLIMGILPRKPEGRMAFVNASRSFDMIMKLREALPAKYVDCVFIFGDDNHGINTVSDSASRELGSTFSLFFTSIHGSQTLDIRDKLLILEEEGKQGIGMISYTKYHLGNPNPQTDMEIEAAKSQIIRIIDENLEEYPRCTVEAGRFGAYQIRCDEDNFPFDLIKLLNKCFKTRLAARDKRRTVLVRGEVWPKPGSDTIEIATMILGINPTKYEYLNRIMDMWKLWYTEKDLTRDFEQIIETKITISDPLEKLFQTLWKPFTKSG